MAYVAGRFNVGTREGAPRQNHGRATNEELYADAVILIARARLWPHVRIEDIAAAAGVSKATLARRVDRFLKLPPKKRPGPKPERIERDGRRGGRISA